MHDEMEKCTYENILGFSIGFSMFPKTPFLVKTMEIKKNTQKIDQFRLPGETAWVQLTLLTFPP